tara:strand:- start:285 stop:827 length:543 start_codon:yes stop_codon:yes gene_type:complete
MIKLLILDIDGVLTDGTKTYDKDHNVLSKRFMCKDFTAIKKFIAANIDVVLISGDKWNEKMAKKRNLEFYCTRDDNLSLDKSKYIKMFLEKYDVKIDEISFVGDDYFDLSMFSNIELTFCPADSPNIIKNNSKIVLSSNGGQGVLVELYDYFISNKLLKEPSLESVLALDAKELTSSEMK